MLKIIIYDDCPGLSESEFKAAAEGDRELPGKQRMGKATPVGSFDKVGARVVIIIGNTDQRQKWLDSERATTRITEHGFPEVRNFILWWRWAICYANLLLTVLRMGLRKV